MTKELMSLQEIEAVEQSDLVQDADVEELIATARAAHKLREENEALRKKWQWVRQRLDVREELSVSGKYKKALRIRTGFEFFDAKTVEGKEQQERINAKVEEAIDEAMKKGGENNEN